MKGRNPLDLSALFSPDYATARQRFRTAAANAGWQLESLLLGGVGPIGTELTLDVAVSDSSASDKALVLSSALHGIEGFFGSAVQLATLNRSPSPPVRCLMLHGLNPYGFAGLRRFDEHNVDLNRNFLLPGQEYAGAPDGYAAFDGFLNPRRPPSRGELFTLKAMGLIAWYGLPKLRQTVAEGQYDFPQGLFFGGKEPCSLFRLLDQHLPRWLGGCRDVVHLDFHTGLGPHGSCKLLIDYPLEEWQRTRLTDWFGPRAYEAFNSRGISYEARGGLGQWCIAKKLAPQYLFACAEFGTYGPVKMLQGLRAENQAHHWSQPQAASTQCTKARLRELFCPASPRWRERVINQSMNLIGSAVKGLSAPE